MAEDLAAGRIPFYVLTTIGAGPGIQGYHDTMIQCPMIQCSRWIATSHCSYTQVGWQYTGAATAHSPARAPAIAVHRGVLLHHLQVQPRPVRWTLWAPSLVPPAAMGAREACTACTACSACTAAPCVHAPCHRYPTCGFGQQLRCVPHLCLAALCCAAPVVLSLVCCPCDCDRDCAALRYAVLRCVLHLCCAGAGAGAPPRQGLGPRGRGVRWECRRLPRAALAVVPGAGGEGGAGGA